MLKLTLVFALLISVCVVNVNSQPTYNPPTYSNWEKVATYVLDKSYPQELADTASSILLNLLNDQVAGAQFCQMLADLLNKNATRVQLDLQASLASRLSTLAQNTAWSTLTDKNGRAVDAFVSADQITLSVNLRLREINRAYMYLKVLTTVAEEMNFTLAIDNYLSIANFRVYATTGQFAALNLSGSTNIQCNQLLLLTAAMLTNPPPAISQLLLGVEAKKQVIANLTGKLSNFISLYTRKASLTTVQDIIDDWLVEGRAQLLDKVNRRVSTWAELEASFGDAIYRNVVKRIFDLADDYFEPTEVLYVNYANITKAATANPPYFEFRASVFLNSTGAGPVVGAKLVNFLRGFVYAYSHPRTVTQITSEAGTSGGSPIWTAVIRVFAANQASFDPRDLTGDKPVLGVSSTDVAENSNNAEFRQTIDQNIRPADIGNATGTVNATITAQQGILANLQTALTTASTEYNALPAFDYNAINTQITAFTAEAKYNASTFRARAEVAAGQVAKAHLLLAAKLKYELVDQNITARNLEILANTLKRQFIILIATLNATSRAGCNVTIPDFRSDSFGPDNIYELAKSSNCANLANVFGQLHLLKKQLLTAVVVKAAVTAKIDALTTEVNSLMTKYQAYEDKIQNTFEDNKNATDYHPILQQTDFKERVAACIKTIVNGTLTGVSYNFVISASNNNSVTHTVTGSFSASANVAVNGDVVLDRLKAGLHLCLSVHIGGDLTYFKGKATGTISAAKRSVQQQQASSSVETDFSEPPPPGSTSGASSVAFCFVFVFMALLALFL